MTLLKIIKLNETESTLTFTEDLTGATVVVTKADFKKAFNRLNFWQHNQNTESFSNNLFRLICYADDVNKIKFLNGFTPETLVWLLWYTSKDEKQFFSYYEKITSKY